MRIKKLRLFNGYKRFHDLTIDLGDAPKKIVALVGPNGCGKSSVLDGMLYVGNAFLKIGSAAGKGFEYHSMHQNPGFDYQNVAIEFDQGTYRTVMQARRAAGTENTIFSFRSPYRYNSSLNVTEIRATTELRLNNYGATYSADIDGKMEENYRRLYVKFNAYMNLHDCKPSEAKSAILASLNQSIRNCLDLEVQSIGNIESKEGSLYFKKSDHPKIFSFNVLSSGEKEVVDILLDLFLRAEVYNDTVFLIDEPELHINTSIQKKLLLEIDKLIGESCQIWITTHSIGFLRALQDDVKDKCQVIQFTDDMALASNARTLTPITPSTKAWRSIFGVALDDLAHLVSPRRIVYCEGRDAPGANAAERGLDAQVYNEIFGHRYPDTLFVSSGGNTELDQRASIAIAVLSKALPAVEILVLKDRDVSSGAVTTLEDRDRYLRLNLEFHRMLRRREIENYLFDKEVLKAYCVSEGLSFNELGYDAKVSDIHEQDVKSLANHMKNFCGINTSASTERFKLRLAKHCSDSQVFRDLVQDIFGV